MASGDIGGFARGFDSVYTDVQSGARIFSYVRTSGDIGLPVLILLHGFPQNALLWKHFVDLLPTTWRIIVPDLPGYGKSTKPIAPASSPGAAHSKRAWAADILALASALFGEHCPVVLVGHDRGARVVYRAAIDSPDRVRGAALLDIVPVSYMWGNMNLSTGHKETHRSSHWIFLSSPRPFPETLIAGNPKYYFEYLFRLWAPVTLASMTPGAQDAPEWVRDGAEPYADSEHGYERIVAACEDYRAGATIDIEHDFASSINPLQEHSSSPGKPLISCPLLVLASGGLRSRYDVDAIWGAISVPEKFRSVEVPNSGHFVVNEQPEQTAEELRNWLTKWFENKV